MRYDCSCPACAIADKRFWHFPRKWWVLLLSITPNVAMGLLWNKYDPSAYIENAFGLHFIGLFLFIVVLLLLDDALIGESAFYFKNNGQDHLHYRKKEHWPYPSWLVPRSMPPIDGVGDATLVFCVRQHGIFNPCRVYCVVPVGGHLDPHATWHLKTWNGARGTLSDDSGRSYSSSIEELYDIASSMRYLSEFAESHRTRERVGIDVVLLLERIKRLPGTFGRSRHAQYMQEHFERTLDDVAPNEHERSLWNNEAAHLLEQEIVNAAPSVPAESDTNTAPTTEVA